MKQAAATPSSAIAFSTLNNCCVRSLDLTPTHCTPVNKRVTPIAVALSWPAMRGDISVPSSPRAIAVAAVAPHVEIQSVQPMTNAGYSPSARRAKMYWPPDFGIMTASSAIVIAPNRAYTPPAIHAPMNHADCGSAAATSPGDRSIPTPIVFPTIMASPKATPRTLSRLEPLCAVPAVCSGDSMAEVTIYP